MQGLKTLSKAVHEHSGIDNPLEGWMTMVFGQWKGFVLSIMVSLATFLAIAVTCVYCCVPSIRALVVCLINRGIMDPVPEGFLVQTLQRTSPTLAPVDDNNSRGPLGRRN